MTVKKKHALNLAWMVLAETCEKYGRMVTAGELAKELGVSRNTAFNLLTEMAAEEAIVFDSRYRGSVPVYRYGVPGYSFE